MVRGHSGSESKTAIPRLRLREALRSKSGSKRPYAGGWGYLAVVGTARAALKNWDVAP